MRTIIRILLVSFAMAGSAYAQKADPRQIRVAGEDDTCCQRLPCPVATPSPILQYEVYPGYVCGDLEPLNVGVYCGDTLPPAATPCIDERTCADPSISAPCSMGCDGNIPLLDYDAQCIDECGNDDHDPSIDSPQPEPSCDDEGCPMPPCQSATCLMEPFDPPANMNL